MDINLLLGISGLAISIMSLFYAAYVTRTSKKEKELVYEIMPPAPVADVIKGDSAYSLKVVYERPNEPSVDIQHAAVQYVRFTNFGKIPIAKSDIAQIDPLRVEFRGGQILDISLVSVTRDACQIKIGQSQQENKITSVPLNFEFLDYLDGGLIQILSDTSAIEATLCGTILGMPEGVRKSKDTADGREISGLGCSIAIAIEIISLAATLYVYWFLFGGWESVWLFLIPIAALILPPAFFLSLVAWTPRAGFKFPEALIPPHWYQMQRGVLYRYKPPPDFKIDKKRRNSVRSESKSIEANDV